MAGLYATLNLGARALQTQSKGLAVAGQNLANVNNPAYSRQRLVVQTSSPITSFDGSEGTGVSAVTVQRVHDSLLDRQIQAEASTSGFWSAQQSGLLSTQTALGEALDTSAGTDGTTSATGITGSSTIASDLSGLFTEFQKLAASPGSLPQRATLLARARSLAGELNGADKRLATVEDNLNRSLTSDVSSANQLLSDIAKLNEKISRAEAGGSGTANDLRDLRQEKVENLAHLADFTSVEDPDGQLTVSVGGEILVSGRSVVASLETQDPGDGRLRLQTSAGVALTLGGGSIQGSIDLRDGTLATLRQDLDDLASNLITEVNAVHGAGYDLTGSTGNDFFTGTRAADIAVNSVLTDDPARIQASGNPAATGDNQTALALARLANQPVAGLGQQTFSARYARTVTDLGEAVANANSQVEDQQLVNNLLSSQRSATSGVSIDEEMADLVKYQKAFQASARIVSIVDQMLDEVISLKR